ncbi:MAG: tetratricopeptide repeat protein [Nitrospirae bacterium]|nr:tetratricopeptide repeat protein [Nitrospirota bacterium]MBF0618440.1 tetratricopeptide repeat protein [Nitrospirota bacterium]
MKKQVLMFLFVFLFVGIVSAGDNTKVTVKGDNNTTITYVNKLVEQNIPEKTAVYLVNNLTEQLQKKDQTIAEKDAQIHEIAKKYEDLQKQLSERPDTDTLAKEAKAKLDSGDLPEAERLLKLSMENNLKDMDKKRKSAASDAFSLATIKDMEIKYQEALSYYEKAVELDPQNALYLNDAGLMYDTLGQYNKAIDYYEQALKIDRQNFDDNHPQIAIYLNNLGGAYYDLGQYEKAITLFKKSLGIREEKLGENHPYVKITRASLKRAEEKLAANSGTK